MGSQEGEATGGGVRAIPFVPPRFQWYMRRLMELYRGRGDNPLAVFNSPTRSPRRRWKFRTVFVLMAMAVVLGGVIISGGNLNVLEGFIGTLYFICPALPLFSLMMFGHRLRRPEHLMDLELTCLRRDEVAFGAAWPAVQVALLLYVPVYLLHVILELMVADWRQESMWAIGRLLLGPAFYLYAIFVAVHAWIGVGESLLRTLVRVVCSHWITLFFTYLNFGLMAVFLFQVLAVRDSSFLVMSVLGSVLTVGVVSYWGYLAGRFSGDRFFAAIDPESLARSSWLAADYQARKEGPLRRAALRRLRRVIWGDWRLNLRAVALAVAGVWIPGAVVGMLVVSSSNQPATLALGALRGMFGVYAVIALGVYGTIAMILLRERRDGPAGVPIVTGSILDSSTRYGFPMVALAVLLVAALCVRDLWLAPHFRLEEALPGSIGYAVSCLLVFALNVMVVLLLLASRRRMRLGLMIAGATALVHLLTLFDAGREGRGDLIYFFEPGDVSGFIILSAAVVMTWVLALAIPIACQRLHETQLRSRPRHVLTSDPVDAA